MMFGVQDKDVDAINGVFSKYNAIEKVLIYGSRAKGNYKNGSDIDLALIETDLSFTEFLEIINKLDDLMLPYKIDISQKRKIANPYLIEHINRIGFSFYEKPQQ